MTRTIKARCKETDQAVSDLHSKQALISSSKANVERLEQLQAFERVTAPFDGVATARNTDIGALVQAGDNSDPKELFHMAAIQTLRVCVAVPEIYAAFVRTGEQAKLMLDALPGKTLTGAVVRNADAIDATARTLNVAYCCCVPEGVGDVEIALREALANAIIHGNHEDRRKHVHVTCRCEPDEVSIAAKDEGSGFDITTVPDPTARENIGSVHGRGILVMKALLNEVRLDEGGAVIHMKKRDVI
jgi:anti-sigma regulatory factor (Ser/Thr protein kinase)